jgi:hypothetical protein
MKQATVSYTPTSSDKVTTITASYNGTVLTTKDIYISDIQANVFVNTTSGNDNNTGVNMETAYKTVTKALSNVASGGVIYIKGTSTETGLIVGKTCTIYYTSGSSVPTGSLQVSNGVTLTIGSTQYTNSGTGKLEVL